MRHVCLSLAFLGTRLSALPRHAFVSGGIVLCIEPMKWQRLFYCSVGSFPRRRRADLSVDACAAITTSMTTPYTICPLPYLLQSFPSARHPPPLVAPLLSPTNCCAVRCFWTRGCFVLCFSFCRAATNRSQVRVQELLGFEALASVPRISMCSFSLQVGQK